MGGLAASKKRSQHNRKGEKGIEEERAKGWWSV